MEILIKTWAIQEERLKMRKIKTILLCISCCNLENNKIYTDWKLIPCSKHQSTFGGGYTDTEGVDFGQEIWEKALLQGWSALCMNWLTNLIAGN